MKIYAYCLYGLLILCTISNFVAYGNHNFFKTPYSITINILTPLAAVIYLVIVLIRNDRLTRRINDQSNNNFHEN